MVLLVMHRQPALMVLTAVLFLCVPGTRQVEAQGGTPSVRLVHVVPGTPPINATVDGQILGQSLAYGTASHSIQFPGGMARLRVFLADEPSRVVLDTPVDLPLDGPSTVLLTGLSTGTPSLGALVLADFLGQTSRDRSRLRFANVAVGIGVVSLLNGENATLFERIGYRAMGDAVLDPGPLFLRAITSDDGTSTIAESRLEAEPGRSYTVILTGQQGSSHPPKLLALDHSRAVPSRAASMEPATAGTVLVDETFSEPTSGLLPILDSGAASLTYGYAGGEFWVRNLDVATQSVPVPVNAVNGTIAVDARLIGDPSRRTVSVGCRFGSDATGNRGYRLRVEPAAGLFRLVREDGKRDVLLRRDSVSQAIRRASESNRLEITCAGITITAAINGTVVATVQDSTYTSGSLVIGVGARASGLTSEARFDNLMITAR